MIKLTKNGPLNLQTIYRANALNPNLGPLSLSFAAELTRELNRCGWSRTALCARAAPVYGYLVLDRIKNKKVQ